MEIVVQKTCWKVTRQVLQMRHWHEYNLLFINLFTYISWFINKYIICCLIQILFLGSGDLRNVLHTIGLSCSTKLEDLHIHLNDNHSSVIARNILILHIITASDFNPNDQNDLEYVWNVWYSTQWDASTVKRFSKDVLQLLVHQWKSDILVVRDLDLVDLDKVWKYWFTTFSSMKASTCSQILSQRYPI